MPRSREATSTIKGYYFQFDYFILRLLYLHNAEDTVCIEGVEDVDITSLTGTDAVQCKYYEGTSCSPSVVGEALRPMLRHFAEYKTANFNYVLFGHYKSGKNSIPDYITVEYAKEKFFTFTEKGRMIKLHEELILTDPDITKFLNHLQLQLDANSYEDQIEKIISQMQIVLGCTEYDARYFYYNNAVAFVKDVAVKKRKSARTVNRQQFMSAIKTKNNLFDKWYIEYIGYEKYYRAIRKQFFSPVNISPLNQFFLIESDDIITDAELVHLIMEIGRKWSRCSKRETNPFCPYVYIHGVTEERLKAIKQLLIENMCYFWDGYDYKGAAFRPASLVRPINDFLGINVKLINKVSEVETVLSECNTVTAVYQFYVKKRFYTRSSIVFGKDFQIQQTMDVLKIV